MWADRETADDLLGFDVLVDELVVALTDAKLIRYGFAAVLV